MQTSAHRRRRALDAEHGEDGASVGLEGVVEANQSVSWDTKMPRSRRWERPVSGGGLGNSLRRTDL